MKEIEERKKDLKKVVDGEEDIKGRGYVRESVFQNKEI